MRLRREETRGEAEGGEALLATVAPRLLRWIYTRSAAGLRRCVCVRARACCSHSLPIDHRHGHRSPRARVCALEFLSSGIPLIRTITERELVQE